MLLKRSHHPRKLRKYLKNKIMNLVDDLLTYRNALSGLNKAKSASVTLEGTTLRIVQGEKSFNISVLNRYLQYQPTKRKKIVGHLYPRYVQNVIFELDELVLNTVNNINPQLIACPDGMNIRLYSSSSHKPCRFIMELNICPFKFISWLLQRFR